MTAKRPAKAVVEPKTTPAPERVECNVPGCPAEPEFRGLCPAHRASMRGFADPKEEK